jgi:hypothetical protein
MISLAHIFEEKVEFEEQEFITSPHEFNSFFESSVWEDLKVYFYERLAQCVAEMQKGLSLEEIREIQGRIGELVTLINLPTHIEEHFNPIQKDG